jgi:TonB-linked SusC/RagA family outer membrane protein
VTIIQTTGMLGGGSRVRIRGSNSFSLSNEPLVYVDGVRVNNDQSTGPVSQAFGSRAISRWNDLNPEDIQSIEIIKGPAAATLYGTEASNGVIQIITKKGTSGAPRFNFSMKQGASWWNPEDQLWTNYSDVGGDGTIESIDIVELEEQRLGSCTRGEDDFFTACPIRSIWRTGHIQNYDLSVSGGSERVRYYASGGLENSTGVEWDNKRKLYNGRLNLSATPWDGFEVTGSIGYVTGTTDLSWEAGGGGPTWTTYYASPARLDGPARGFWSWTPEMYHELADTWQDVERTTLSFNLDHRPTTWFNHRLAIGRDFTREEDVEIMYHDERWLDLDSFADRGYKEMWSRATEFTTADYAANFTFDVNPDLNSVTSVGGQLYRRDYAHVYAYGENFPVPGLSSIEATTQSRVNSESEIENVTLGAFVQQQIGWKNRLFLTAALRGDDNSAFGQEFDFVTYPKVSAAWVISEEPFWSIPSINTLKLRAAYGESGQQPDAFVAIRTFNPAPGPGGSGTVTPDNLGNPELGPERGQELEFGFDVALLDDRLGVEATYYSQRTDEAILLREIAPSTGFSGSQHVNAGEITNKGFELLVRGEPWRTERHGLELSLNVATNDNEVKSLGDVTDENFVSAGSMMRHQIGYPVASWFGRRLVSAQMDDAGEITEALCDDGAGGTIDCAEAPHVFLGGQVPDLEGGFNATLTLFDRFRIFGQMDFKTGFHKLDGNYRVRCVLFNLCHENWFPTEHTAEEVALAENAYESGMVQPADFAKLREVSISYNVPAEWVSRFGATGATISLAGRNLATWTKFPGLEPESSFNAGSRGGSALWEQNVLPQLQQFIATVNLSF